MTEFIEVIGEKYRKIAFGVKIKNNIFASFCFVDESEAILSVGSVDNVSDPLMMAEYDFCAKEKGAKYLLVRAHKSRDERQAAERLLRSNFFPLESRKTEKYIGAIDVCKIAEIDHSGFARTDDLYAHLERECYFWDVEGKFFQKKHFSRRHEGSRYLELQVRSSRSGDLSSLRIRSGKIIINEIEFYIREKLKSVFLFEKRVDVDLRPPNDNDIYIYLYANFNNYVETAYLIAEKLKLFDVIQIHERDSRDGSDPFIDLKFDVKKLIEFNRLSNLNK